MVWIGELRDALSSFFETGGDVLYFIFVATFLMWSLIIERIWYLKRVYPNIAERVVRDWTRRNDHHSWYAMKIRRQVISEINVELQRHQESIKTLIAICPLLGLLGTTTGMIEVYDAMAFDGTGNPRALASGVAKAMITTMAGLVVALSGVFISAVLQRRAIEETQRLETRLVVAGADEEE